MLVAAGIGPGDEVIIPSFTWIATANAVMYVGATPVLADIDLDSLNISIEDIQRKITKKTKAVIVVHLFGNPFDVEKLKEELPKDIKIFEDAACAAGASIKNKKIGGLGLAAAFSFHPRKSITTGEGGMLTTNDEDLYLTAEKYRNHGAELSEEQRHFGSQPYLLPEFGVVGFNYRMTDIQAAIGRVQLTKLADFIRERNEIAQTYNEVFSRIEWIKTPFFKSNITHALQAYVLRIDREDDLDTRNKMMKYLHMNGIASRPGTHAIHTLKIYKDKFRYDAQDLPESNKAAKTTIALPLHNKLTLSQIDYICDKVMAFE
jgi:dTDP-4-amino-4,6-dideoxygalactose transaminase